MLLTAEGFCFSRFVHLIILFSILCIEKEAAMLRGRGGRSPVQSVSYSFVCVKWGQTPTRQLTKSSNRKIGGGGKD